MRPRPRIAAVIVPSSAPPVYSPGRFVCPACRFRLSPNATRPDSRLSLGQRPFSLARPRLSSKWPQGHDPQSLAERLRTARPLVPHSVSRRFTQAGQVKYPRTLMCAVVAAAVLFYTFNSQLVPVTGRRRFNFFSEKLVDLIWRSAAQDVIEDIEQQGGRFLSDWDSRTMAVKRVMKRMIPVSGMSDLDWDIHVIADDETANAFVLPGGKVFVYSGIIDICRGDDGLAAVLGHEIAHNTASHVAERMSSTAIGALTAGSLFFLAGAVPGLALFTLWSLMGGYYIRDLVYALPIGRKQETEADYLGLMMMAEACYDPRQAVLFWQRMNAIQQQGGQEVPEMLSTHPSSQHRIKEINKWLPEAMDKLAESDCRGTQGLAEAFRIAVMRGTPWLIKE